VNITSYLIVQNLTSLLRSARLCLQLQQHCFIASHTTPWCIYYFEKLSNWAVNKFLDSQNQKIHCCVHKSPPLASIPCHFDLVYIFTLLVSQTTLISSSNVHLSLQSDRFSWCFVWISLFPLHPTCHAHLIIFNLIHWHISMASQLPVCLGKLTFFEGCEMWVNISQMFPHSKTK
jgi:hypothetical protein